MNLSARNAHDSIPLRGVRDSVFIAVEDLKIANSIMVRLAYKNAAIEARDSLLRVYRIELNRSYLEYEKMRDEVVNINALNEALTNDLERSKKRNRILGGVAGGSLAALLFFIILK